MIRKLKALYGATKRKVEQASLRAPSNVWSRTRLKGRVFGVIYTKGMPYERDQMRLTIETEGGAILEQVELPRKEEADSCREIPANDVKRANVEIKRLWSLVKNRLK